MRTSSPRFHHRNERNAVKLIAERHGKFLNSALPEWIDDEFWLNPLKKFSCVAHLFDNDVFKYAAFFRGLIKETDNFLCNKSYNLPLKLQISYRDYPWIRKLTSSVSNLHVTMGSCFTNYWDNQKEQRVVDRFPVVRLTDSRGVFIELLGDSDNDPNPEFWRLCVASIMNKSKEGYAMMPLPMRIDGCPPRAQPPMIGNRPVDQDNRKNTDRIFKLTEHSQAGT